MAKSYANILDTVEQQLQDTSNATYSTTELGYWIEEELKELGTYDPHIVEVIFKVESRTGTDVTGTGSSLTDLVKLQFLTADATDEKVIHNATDNTRAVVLTRTSSSVLTLSADIMDADENYSIYNKRCRNNRQIYIGDVTDYLDIDSVEYPIGTNRNWEVYGDVLEIGADSIADSDSTLTSLGNVDVLVRFKKPHKLCQLADLVGEVHTEGATNATTLQVKYFTDDQIVEIGDEFHIANHRSLYTVTTGVTLDLQTSTGKQIGFFPGLEAVAPVGDGITFTKSTLKPQGEDVLTQLIVARAGLSKLANNISKGGVGTYSRYETKLAIVLDKLERLQQPVTRRLWSRG